MQQLFAMKFPKGKTNVLIRTELVKEKGFGWTTVAKKKYNLLFFLSPLVWNRYLNNSLLIVENVHVGTVPISNSDKGCNNDDIPKVRKNNSSSGKRTFLIWIYLYWSISNFSQYIFHILSSLSDIYPSSDLARIKNLTLYFQPSICIVHLNRKKIFSLCK